MSVNDKAKKLTTISQTAIKGIGHGQVQAWFLIEYSKKNFYFLVDKKLKSAAKFSKVAVLKKLLELYGVNTKNIKDDSPFLAGTVGLAEGTHEMVVSIKKNGAGKSTLKGVVAKSGFKKILKTVAIVKAHKISENETEMTNKEEEEYLEETVLNQEVATKTAKLDLNKEEQKALKIAIWAKDHKADMETSNPTAEMEDFFHTAIRRLEKFKTKKHYKLFAKAGFFKKKNPLVSQLDGFILDKKNLTKLLKKCNDQLKLIQLSIGAPPPLIEDLQAGELFDQSFVTALTDFNSFLKKTGFKESEIPEIMNAFGVDNQSELEGLLKDCGGIKNLKVLLKSLGSNDWFRLLSMLDRIEMEVG